MSANRSLPRFLASVLVFALLSSVAAAQESTHGIERLMRELQVRKMIVGVVIGGNRNYQPYSWPTADYQGQSGCNPGLFPQDGFYSEDINSHTYPLQELAAIANQAGIRAKFLDVAAEFLQEAATLTRDDPETTFHGYQYINGAADLPLSLDNYEDWHFSGDTGAPWDVPATLDETTIVDALSEMLDAIGTCRYVSGSLSGAENEYSYWVADGEDPFGENQTLEDWFAAFVPGIGEAWDPQSGGAPSPGVYQEGVAKWINDPPDYVGWGGDSIAPAWYAKRSKYAPSGYAPSGNWPIPTDLEVFGYVELMDPAQPPCTDPPVYTEGAPFGEGSWRKFDQLAVAPPTGESQEPPTTRWDNTFSGGGSSDEFDLTAYESCTIDGDTIYDFNRGGWEFNNYGVWKFSFSPPVSEPCQDDDQTVPWPIDDGRVDTTPKDSANGTDGGTNCGDDGGIGDAADGMQDPRLSPPAGGGEPGEEGGPPDGGRKICHAGMPPDPNCNPGFGTGGPVEYRNAFKYEQAIDLTVAVEGGDFSLVRHYTGSPNYVSNLDRDDNGPSLVGEGWSLSSLMYLDVQDGGDTLALRSWPATVEYPFSNPQQSGSEWTPLGASPLRIIKSFAWIDAGYWPTWELQYPGQWSMHFVRTFEPSGFDLGETAADRYGDYVVGQLVLSTDLYGHKRTYSWYDVSFTENSVEYHVPRLKAIHLNGSALQFGDADIRFQWLFDGDTPDAIGGQLDEVRVVRRDAGGAEVVTQRVDYIYGAEDLVAASLSDDVAYNGTGDDESTELVQVVKYTLVDDAPTGADPYRVQITQYRYHDGTSSSTGDERLDAYGLRSQLKSVIMPQQVEYYAEHRTGDSWDPEDRVWQASLELLTMDDDDTPAGWDAGTAPMVVDFAAKIVDYTSTGLVEDQFMQASCGCSGAGQSVRMSYQLESYDISSGDDRGRSLVITEAVDEGSGFVDYRRLFYDVTRTGSEFVPLLTSRAVAELDSQGSEGPVWAEVIEYDSTSLRPETYISPSAVSAYSNDPTDSVKPSITVSTGAGLVFTAEYNTEGFVTAVYRREGSQGTDEDLYEITYGSDPDHPWTERYPVQLKRFRVGSGYTADQIETTTIDYVFYQRSNGNGGSEDSTAISAITITTEPELPAENGPAGATGYSTTRLYGRDGHLRWVRQPDGRIDWFDYDPATSQPVTIAGNVDPTGEATGSPNPEMVVEQFGLSGATGWGGRHADGGFAVSTRTYDLLGRLASSTSPAGVASYLVRDIAAEDSTELGQSGSDVLYYRTLRFPHLLADQSTDGPVSVSWLDAGGKSLRSSGFELDIQGSYDPPTPDDVDWAAELSRQTATISYAGLVTKAKRWLDLDATGRVAETEFEYDALGRRTAVTDPNGTVRRTVFDVLDRPIEGYLGDSSGDLLVQALYYDSGDQAVRTGAGNSNLTVIVQHTGEDGTLGAATRTTVHSYDWRDRLIATENPQAPHQALKYDNLDRVIASAVYSTLPTIDSDGVAIETTTGRGAYSETLYSQRGLPYRARVAIDPSQASPSFLESDTWYDQSGRQVASQAPNSPVTVTEYDGLGRAARSFVTDRSQDTERNGADSFEEVIDLTGDLVIEETTHEFRADTLLELSSTTVRPHDLSGAGEIGLDDGVTTFVGYVYDDAARQVAAINFGTNADGFEPAGSSGVPSVPSTTPDRDTSPWDETIITEQTYNARGLPETVVDPEGKVTRHLYDDANRRVAVVENYVSTNFGFGWDATSGRWEVTGGLSGSTPDVNRVTSYTHDLAGNVKYQTAHLPPSGGGSEDVQVTEYVYGVTAVTSNPADTDSLITSNALLKEARYPNESTGEPGTTDEYKVRYAYNRLGELRSVVDQNGTTHVYSRDDAGRAIKDWVSAFGADVDGQGTNIDTRVKGIQIGYDSFGRVLDVESLDSSSVVLNGVEFGYSPLWQVSAVYQDPTGAVTYDGAGDPTGDTEVVRYAYSESASGNHSRLTSMTYPDGSVLQHHYGSSTGDTDDLVSRVTRLSIGPSAQSQTDIVLYDHVGLGMFAEVDYAVPDIQLDRTASHDGKRAIQGFSTQTTGLYPAWDRFGRVIRHMWVDGDFDEHGSTAGYPDRPPLFETTHTYDRTSNRLTRYDERTGAQMPNWDFEYEYDGLDRLVAADRGEIEGSTFTPGAGVQEWTLDMLGNWSTWNHDRNGDGDFLDSQEVEDRDHNAANEITSLDIQGLTGSPFTQHRDKAGNWTRNKRSAASNLEYTHDAWNRLVKVRQLQSIPASTQGEYEYNGLHWRTVRKFPKSGNTEERRMFYSASWQLLEERIDTDNSGGFTEEKCAQTVWGLRYIDDAVLRRQDTNQDYDYADSGERTDYFITDPQFSVVAVVDDAGALEERVAYSPYGEARHHFPFDLDGDGDVDSTDTGLISLKTIDQAGYNPDADMDRNGTVNSIDYIAALGATKAALAKGLISDPNGSDNPIGYDGYIFNAETKLYTVRFRHYEPVTGGWMERDRLTYVDGQNSIEFVRSQPIVYTDTHALAASSSCEACDQQGDGRRVDVKKIFLGTGKARVAIPGSDISDEFEDVADDLEDYLDEWKRNPDPTGRAQDIADLISLIGALRRGDDYLAIGVYLNNLKGRLVTLPYDAILDIMFNAVKRDLARIADRVTSEVGVVPILELAGECCEPDKNGNVRWTKHSMQLVCDRDALSDVSEDQLSDPPQSQYKFWRSFDPNSADVFVAASDCARAKDQHFKCPSGEAGQGAFLLPPLPGGESQ